MNRTTSQEFIKLLNESEGCNLEFKTAKNNFSTDQDLPDYCAALANEGGGKLVLGVKGDVDNKEVIGTSAFSGTYNKLPNELLNKIGIRIDVEELVYCDKRVLIFHIPSRKPGNFIRSTGKYRIPMRAGESLCEMDDITLKKILKEDIPDFSAQPVSGIGLGSLDESAIQKLRNLCLVKTGNKNYENCSDQQLLKDIGLIKDGIINFAALILLGRKEVLRDFLPQAEIVFEWRQVSSKIAHDYRKNWRDPFINIIDEIWGELGNRNVRTPFQQGFLQREILAFDERSIREAVLNAVAHRDYSINAQSIFISASPNSFLIESPGGFLPGVTPENAIFERAWRNKRLAEVLEKTGLVERSGQGLDLIFEHSIRSGKGLPDLSQSTDHSVKLFIPTTLIDPSFVLFLEKIINEKQISLSFEEMLELEDVRAKGVVSKIEHAKKFLKLGIIEKHGRTKGSRYMLSHLFYVYRDKKGTHTRLVGLERSKYKELILAHIIKNGEGKMSEFSEAFPELSTDKISNLLRDLRADGAVLFEGSKRGGRWVLRP